MHADICMRAVSKLSARYTWNLLNLVITDVFFRIWGITKSSTHEIDFQLASALDWISDWRHSCIIIMTNIAFMHAL
jgi:hypothetical protein